MPPKPKYKRLYLTPDVSTKNWHPVNVKLFKAVDLLIEMGFVESKADFCRTIGLRHTTLDKIFKNPDKYFLTAPYVQKMADILNVNPNYLYSKSASVLIPDEKPKVNNRVNNR